MTQKIKATVILPALLVLLTNVITFGDHKTTFVAGGLYNEQVANLRASGFDTVICWSIHVNSSGVLGLNNDTLIDASGNYVYGQWARDNMAKLKQAPTSISRVEFSVGSAGAADFEGIEHLVNTQGTGPGSVLYQNFQKLRTTFPQVDAINFDDESNYDVTTTTQFAVMLADFGYKVTFCPYTRRTTFWSPLYTAIEQQRPGTVDHIYLQCYAGGGFNDPGTWNGSFGSLIVEPGMWAWEEDTPAQVEAQMTSWRSSASITGGFIWRLSYMWSGGYTPSDYSTAIANALAGVLEIVTQPTDVVLSADVLGTSQDVFTVNAASDYVIQYQWYKTTDFSIYTPADDAAVGTNSNVLTLPNVQISDEGYYFCHVTDADGGSVKSNVVRFGIQQLLAHWTLDQSKFVGNQYLDETGRYPANPNTPVAVSFEPGQIGEAVQIDTINTWATTAAWDPLADTNQMTVSLWSKWDGVNGTWQVLMNQQTTAPSRRWQISTNQNSPDLWFQGTNTLAYANALVPDVWQHICVVYNGGAVDIYIDGLLKQSGTVTLGGDAGQILLGTASSSGSFTLNGSLDDVRIYNYSMDKYGVAELYYNSTGNNLCIDDYDSAYDFTGPQGTPDCKVDLLDFAELIANWLDCGLYPQCQ